MIELGIEEQKYEARELLTKLKRIDPFAMVAGGAPRDWYFNTPARDADIYLRLPNHNTLTLVTRLLQDLGMEEVGTIPQSMKSKENSYAELPNLKWVLEGIYNGLKINIMVMDKGVREEIIKDFDVSICRAWFDGNQCYYFADFEFTVKTGICTIHENYTGKELHIRKMAKRFPNFQFMKAMKIEPLEEVVLDNSAPMPPEIPAPMKRKSAYVNPNRGIEPLNTYEFDD